MIDSRRPYLLFALFPVNAAWLGVEAQRVLACGVFVWLGWRASFRFRGLAAAPLWDAGFHLLGPGTHLAGRLLRDRRRVVGLQWLAWRLPHRV